MRGFAQARTSGVLWDVFFRLFGSVTEAGMRKTAH